MPQTITISTTDDEQQTANIADIDQIKDGSTLGDGYGATIILKDGSIIYSQENLAELLERISNENN